MNKIAKIVLISVGIGGASLLGGISLVNIGINIENEPAQPISPEELAEQSDIENKKDGLRAMKEGDFFRLWSIFMLFQTNQNWLLIKMNCFGMQRWDICQIFWKRRMGN